MTHSSSSADLTVSLLDDARELSGDITDMRHDLHRHVSGRNAPSDSGRHHGSKSGFVLREIVVEGPYSVFG